MRGTVSLPHGTRKIELRTDKHSNVHFVIGKASFSPEQLNDNISAVLEEVVRLKPSSSKGRYIQKTVEIPFGATCWCFCCVR